MSAPSVEMSVVQDNRKMPFPVIAEYERLGISWSWSYLFWDKATNKKTGGGQKPELNDPYRPFYVNKNGQEISTKAVILYCNGKVEFMMIDIDSDNEYCEHMMTLLKDCNMIQKTRKGWHYYYKATPEIAQTANQEVKIDIRTPYQNGICFAEPSAYTIPGEGLIQYKWEKLPGEGETLMDLPTEAIEYLHSLGYKPYAGTPAPKINVPLRKRPTVASSVSPPASPSYFYENELTIEDVMTDGNNKIPERLQYYNQLLRCITPAFLGDREKWIRIGFCCKNIENSVEMREIFIAHSARGGYDGKYNKPEYRVANRAWWENQPAMRGEGKPLTVNSLKHWAKECNTTQYFQLAKTGYWKLIELGNSPAMCEMFYNEMAGDILYSPAWRAYVIYDQVDKIWKVVDQDTRAVINNLFIQTVHSVLYKLLSELPVAVTEEDVIKRKQKQKTINELIKKTDGKGGKGMVEDNLKSYCTMPEDPATFFNQAELLIPLENGVYDIKKGKLVSYERDHYFTFRIPISYDEHADTTDIEKAMNDWFKGKISVIDFIQMYIGYCMTGNRDRQDMLCVWGKSAGNGKSELWGYIMNTLLGEDTSGAKSFYYRLTSEALMAKRSGENNDQIYNLNGKRMAFLSEPNKKFNTQLIKELTGDKTYTASAKYKGALTFQLITKLVMCCNTLPEIDFVTDEGMARRFLTVEMNVKFLPEEQYEALTPKQKLSGKYGKQDGEFMKRLKENKAGLMKWAIEGVRKWWANPKAEPPKEMIETKKKAVVQADEMGKWIKARLATEDSDGVKYTKADKVKLSEIKRIWRNDLINWGQNENGFNDKFLDRVEALVPGAVVNRGREGKGDAYISHVKYIEDIIEDDDDDEEVE